MRGATKLGQIAALSLTVLTVLGGYSQVSAEPVIDSPAPPTDQQIASNNASSSSETRQGVSLSNALLGQWTTNNGATHYYFSRDRLTIVNFLRGQDTLPYQQEMEYEIISVNEAAGLVFLKVETPLGWAETRMIRFSPNRQALTELMNVVGHNFNSEWVYVDNDQQPLIAEQPNRSQRIAN